MSSRSPPHLGAVPSAPPPAFANATLPSSIFIHRFDNVNRCLEEAARPRPVASAEDARAYNIAFDEDHTRSGSHIDLHPNQLYATGSRGEHGNMTTHRNAKKRNQDRNWSPCTECRCKKVRCIPSKAPHGKCVRCVEKSLPECVPSKSKPEETISTTSASDSDAGDVTSNESDIGRIGRGKESMNKQTHQRIKISPVTIADTTASSASSPIIPSPASTATFVGLRDSSSPSVEYVDAEKLYSGPDVGHAPIGQCTDECAYNGFNSGAIAGEYGIAVAYPYTIDVSVSSAGPHQRQAVPFSPPISTQAHPYWCYSAAATANPIPRPAMRSAIIDHSVPVSCSPAEGHWHAPRALRAPESVPFGASEMRFYGYYDSVPPVPPVYGNSDGGCYVQPQLPFAHERGAHENEHAHAHGME